MKRLSHTLLLWLGIEAAYLASLLVLPFSHFDLAGFLSYSSQTLLCLLAISLVRREPARRNKFIFVNFALFFGFSFLAHLFTFVGTGEASEVIPGSLFFSDPSFAKMILDQYVFRGAYFFFLALAIVYLTIDILFRDLRTVIKYGVTLLIVGSFFGHYYRPFFEDPLYLHKTKDVTEWKILDEVFWTYKKTHGEEPSLEALSASVFEQGLFVNTPNNRERVQALYPYLFGENWRILVYKPLHLNQIYMSVVCVGFILLFFGYQFMKDPPQGAYVEKVMFAFLIFSTLEIVHAYMSIASLQWQAFNEMVTVGQYISIGVLLLIALFFMLRIRFVTSANGEFYESELASSPSGITRWRDTVDNIVIEKFFNRKLILGRLLVDPTRK
ncbi:MAG: hypothetical protein WBG01_12930 [Bacteroidota bacterium]